MSQAHSGQRRSREHRAAISAGVRQHLRSKLQHEEGRCVSTACVCCLAHPGVPPAAGGTRRRCPTLPVQPGVDFLYSTAGGNRWHAATCPRQSQCTVVAHTHALLLAAGPVPWMRTSRACHFRTWRPVRGTPVSDVRERCVGRER